MKFYLNLYIFIEENAFENVVWKKAAILSRPQCVKVQGQSLPLEGSLLGPYRLFHSLLHTICKETVSGLCKNGGNSHQSREPTIHCDWSNTNLYLDKQIKNDDANQLKAISHTHRKSRCHQFGAV